MRLMHEAVFMNAGSYDITPKSDGSVLIWRRSLARIVPLVIGNVYCFPVRLSMTVRLSAPDTAPAAPLLVMLSLPRVATASQYVRHAAAAMRGRDQPSSCIVPLHAVGR